MPDIQAISLYDLNQKVKHHIYDGFLNAIWIVAEISQINENRSGHCYLELIDKDPDNDDIRASSRATIWSSKYRMIKPYFETTTGQSLQAGIKVMVSVKVDYHERYGLSLNITDIEPSFTMGDLARKRMEIIKKLEEFGVINMNREIDLPLVPQKIAVISSDTAAGYGDFIDQLKNNSQGIQYYVKLYQASMQGSDTSISIRTALDKISGNIDFFDLVVIIRGGGAKTDLSSFDDFDLAYFITQFPLPIVTGIGHERDESIADIVAHTSCKTPTAVAEFIIEQAEYFISDLDDYKSRITDIAREQLIDLKEQLIYNSQNIKNAADRMLKDEKSGLKDLVMQTSSATSRYAHQHEAKLLGLNHKAVNQGKSFLNDRKEFLKSSVHRVKILTSEHLSHRRNQLILFQKETELQDPVRILKRGYSISYAGGKVIKSSKDLKEGDEITTKLSSGLIKSVVKTKTDK